MKTFILGSSHVSRLGRFMRENLDVRLENHEVRIQGVNGGMVNSMYRYVTDVYQFQPQVVFLQIGSNDIGMVDNTVDVVYLAIEHLIEVLLSLNVKHVMVGLLFQRERVLFKRGLTLAQYNNRVYLLNCRLHQLQCPQFMTFWVHRGLQYPGCSVLDRHGVHLNEEGNRRLVKSVRGAIMYAEILVNGNCCKIISIDMLCH